MKIEFWVIGKTNAAYLKEGMSVYEKRITRYLKMETIVFPDIKNAKNLSAAQVKVREGEILLSKLQKGEYLILLDEKGKAFTSTQFASFLNQELQLPHAKIIFLVGGAYGFSSTIYERANFEMQLSTMTFSHQMIRLFFLEQFYRAMTILKNEPYHNE